MTGDVDARLVGLLRASLGLSDMLRDLGVGGDIAVSLNREGGLALLAVVTGQTTPEAEALSQRGRTAHVGENSLSVGGLTFRWPKRRLPIGADNDNGTTAPRRYGFEEESPALR